MPFTTRLCVFAVLAIAGVVAWHSSAAPDDSRDLTHLAVQQFQNDDSVPVNLQQASLAQNWWPLVWPALLAGFAIVLFWDDAERWWKQEET